MTARHRPDGLLPCSQLRLGAAHDEVTARHRLAFAAVLVAYLLLGAGFALRTPIWQNPDEPAHYNYVRSLATGQGIPILQPGAWDSERLNALLAARFPADAAIDWMTYEAHQPPLYYALAAPFLAAAGNLPVADQVHLVRLFSVALGALGLVVARAIARAVVPARPWLAVAVPAFLVAVPQHVADNAAINNDVLAELVLGLILLALLRSFRQPIGTSAARHRHLLLSVLLGLALLTKTTIYAAVLLIPIGLALEGKGERGKGKGETGKRFLLRSPFSVLLSPFPSSAPFPLAVVAGWWFVRNAVVYGGFDLLGWQRHDLVVAGQPRTVLGLSALQHFVVVTFQSFWAQLGWMAVPAQPNDYRALLAIVAIAGIGLVALLARPDPSTRLDRGQGRGLVLLGLTLAVVVAQPVWYNLQFVQPQGRYLFPAIVPIAIFWSLGLAEVLRRPPLRPVAVALVLVAALFAIWQIRALVPAGLGSLSVVLGGGVAALAAASLAVIVGRLTRRWAPPALLACAFAAFDLTALVRLVAFLK